MNLTGGIVLYAVLWFLTLFILLPIGLISQDEAGEVVPGTHGGAPHNPELGRKALWATVISAVLWVGCAYLILGGAITQEDVIGWDRLIR
ncbi:DUF1467 family protein [Paracoccus aerodenitrificans]|uniref:DUF1467 family protein n=1 Tax=Paracoccus aerodenitrificans TaxID=3017781 RepID=UPI0022F051A3|nr:DUF1467 family protein [Paracoccus aerodenitrificans]WBU64411.1 DUF1467 family protein [Paracoccus aerodenitrificans]